MLRPPNRVGDYDIRPVSAADQARLLAWIAKPHWQEWWGEPQKEWAMIEADFTSDASFAYIFGQGGRDIGYIQYWVYGKNRAYAEEIGETYLRDFPDETIGVDLSIGAAADLGQGHGHKVLRAFCQALSEAGASTITIDPDLANARAVHAYQKAGFKTLRDYGETRLMIWQGSEATP